MLNDINIKDPKISVLMAVYNGEKYLREAINSILNQTFTDFEFIIVDDGSTDRTPKILKEYAKQYKCIRLIRNTCNLGLTRSLNKGLSLACGTYIARQDADDISLPERLALQICFLENHPEIGVVGTWVALLDKEGRETDIIKKPSSPVLVKWFLLFGNCLAHTSVMIRRSLLEGGVRYRPEILYAQDYELWARLSGKTLLTNLPKVLCLIRLHEQRISAKHFKLQKKSGQLVMRQLIANLLGKDVPEALLKSLQRPEVFKTQEELGYSVRLITQLYKAYIVQNMLNAAERDKIAENAAIRIVHVALQNVERWPISASWAMLLALSINWRVMTRSCALAIRKFIKRLSFSPTKNFTLMKVRLVRTK